MKSNTPKCPLILALFLLLGGGCDYDHGLDPVPYRIKGSVIFEGRLPSYDQVNEVRIVVAKKVPPENFTTDVILSDPLPFSRDTSRVAPDTVHYELVVQSGSYAITSILWRPEGQGWSIANLIGLYGVNFRRLELAPKEVVITADNPIADSVDIYAYWDFANRDAAIAGNIKFNGEWQQNTDFFVLGFYENIPSSPFEYIRFKSFQFILQRAPVAVYSYFAPVKSGKYKFVALFWKGKATSLFDIRAIGIYRCSNDTARALPNSVEVKPGATIDNINFEADFSTLPVGVIFSAIENCGQP